MASCDKETYTNIKNLPQVFNVMSGDFLIIENPQGTNIISYDDVTWSLDNMTFSSSLCGFSNGIASAEAKVQNLSSTVQSLSSTTRAALVTTGANIASLSGLLKSMYRIKNSPAKTIMLALSDAYTYIRVESKDNNQIWLTKLPWSIGTEITFRRTTEAGQIDILTEDGVVVNDDVSNNVSVGNTFMIKYLGNNVWDFI